MNNINIAQQLSSIRNLLQNNTIGIIVGEGLNQDTAAAGLGLYLSLKDADKNPQIVSKKEATVEIANLVGINKLSKSFSGNSSKVVVSLPYIKGEIGKVSYKEENDRINFYLTAVEGKSITQYDTDAINLNWDGSSPGVVFVLGVSSPMSIQDFVDSNSGVKIINIDTQGESFGDVSIVNSGFSSTSEIVAKIIKDLNLPTSIDIAQNLLDGIVYGTRNFTKSNSSPLAFELTGYLMQLGAVRNEGRSAQRGSSQQPSQNKPRERFQNQGVGQNQSQNFNQNTNQGFNQNQPNNRQNLGQGQSSNQPQPQPQNRNKREDFSKPSNSAQNSDRSFSSQEVISPNSGNQNEASSEEIPNDWLMPKVFKGSQNADDLK